MIFYFHPQNLGKIPNLPSIFFKGVGSTTNQEKIRLESNKFTCLDVWQLPLLQWKAVIEIYSKQDFCCKYNETTCSFDIFFKQLE